MMTPKYITVHCSATRPKNPCSVEDINAMHLANGWSGIGYHFYITRDGNMNVGRPLNKQGAHVGGHNKDNVGICLEGGLNDDTGTAEDNFTEAQMDQLRYVITEMQSNYGIKDEDVKGHRDWFGDTNGDGVIDSRDWLKECPCFDVKTKLNDWCY